ncbi:MAG: DNA adenine methylase [Planctomycetes bacterium]|nr:DNA adenine methylase [Planctomycetota bacterium]
MRYLGNKTKLLGAIEAAARRLGFEGGTVCDLFAGSGAVSRFFRSRGCRVLACDLMESSHVFQRVHLELDGAPSFDRLRSAVDLRQPGEHRPELPEGVTRTIAHLERVPATDGLFTRQYSPDGVAGRAFFRPDVTRRIDAIIAEIRDWFARDLIDELERDYLTAALIDAADRRANISGTYGAFLKRWQSNADGQLRLVPPEVGNGPVGAGHLGDASTWIGEVDADLLYLDPPYNGRQYAANYHIFEVIVRAVRCDDPPELEASIYGKTGLVPWRDKASKLCSRRGRECHDAFREILRATRIPRVVISYNEEGIITRDEFREMLSEYAGEPVEAGEWLTEIPYRRFRSDADGRISTTGSSRSYKSIPGRERDEVREWLFHVRRR